MNKHIKCSGCGYIQEYAACLIGSMCISTLNCYEKQIVEQGEPPVTWNEDFGTREGAQKVPLDSNLRDSSAITLVCEGCENQMGGITTDHGLTCPHCGGTLVDKALFTPRPTTISNEFWDSLLYKVNNSQTNESDQ